MSPTRPTPSTELLAGLVEVARLRLGLPDGEPAEVRAFYPDDVDGIWIVPLFHRDQGRVVVLMTEGDQVAAHAGLSRAAARLRGLDLLERADDWVTDNIRPLLDAAGGLTPGYPRYPSERAARRDDGGVRLTLDEPESWVRFAAAGAPGAPPPDDLDTGGIRPPERRGLLVCDVTADYRLEWSYALDGEQVGGFRGAPDDDVPDRLPPRRAEALLAAARARLDSPLAVPAAPVAPAGERETIAWRVELLGLGAVVVDETEEG